MRDTLPLRVFDAERARPSAPRAAPASRRDERRGHFAQVRGHSTRNERPTSLSRRSSAGSDHYTRTTFEFKDTAIGAQDTITGGGRYDYLVEEIGGRALPAWHRAATALDW